MKHLLAMALKPEMPRLDNAGVNRAHGHFMNFLTGHLKKIPDLVSFMKGVSIALLRMTVPLEAGQYKDAVGSVKKELINAVF